MVKSKLDTDIRVCYTIYSATHSTPDTLSCVQKEREAKMKIAGIIKHSMVDGPGVRFVVFTQGCSHHCTGCHNPETWDPDRGIDISVDEIVSMIRKTKFLDGITFSGGDPMLQAKECIELAKALSDYNIWCYTGWTLEEIEEGKAGEDAKELLRHIDVLVDGRFVKDLKTDTCKYRGSSNQKIIQIKKKKEGGIK